MTLIELLVVLAILAIISGITLFDYSSFRSNASLQNLSDDIALSIRKAQSYAIGAKATSVSNTNSFSNKYGIHFSKDDPYSFIIFTDISGDYKYTGDNSSCGVNISSSNECLEKLTISSGDYISDIIYGGSNTSIGTGSLDITFLRPNPDATFRIYNTDGNVNINNSSRVGIVISNDKGDNKKLIYVTILGKISIQNNYSPTN